MYKKYETRKISLKETKRNFDIPNRRSLKTKKNANVSATSNRYKYTRRTMLIVSTDVSVPAGFEPLRFPHAIRVAGPADNVPATGGVGDP